MSLPPAHSRCLFPCCPHVYVFYLTTLKVCMLSHLFPCSTTRTWPNTAALRCLFCLSFVYASSHSGSTLQPKWHYKWVYLALCWFLSYFQAHVCLMTASHTVELCCAAHDPFSWRHGSSIPTQPQSQTRVPSPRSFLNSHLGTGSSSSCRYNSIKWSFSAW